MNYTAKPDSILGDRIHINLFNDTGSTVREQWHDQNAWDADNAAIVAEMIGVVEFPQPVVESIPVKNQVAIVLDTITANNKRAAVNLAKQDALVLESLISVDNIGEKNGTNS